MKKELNCSNLLKELSKVATNKEQQKLLEDLSTYSKTNELSPKQKELANKLYKQLQEKLIQSKTIEIRNNLEKLDPSYIESYIAQWRKNTSFYPLKDIQEMFSRVLNHPVVQQHKNYIEMIGAYGREFAQ